MTSNHGNSGTISLTRQARRRRGRSSSGVQSSSYASNSITESTLIQEV